MEKDFSCAICNRPINHRGCCLACNIKKSREENYAPVNKTENPIAKFIFPFPSMRNSQKEMISDVRSAVESKKHLIADAPTGLGKTIAALFPAVEYAVNNNKTVFFLTSRLSQHKAAVEALKMMKASGGVFYSVDVIGKKHLCSHDVSDMDSSMFSNFCSSMIKEKKCDFYRNFYRKDIASERSGMISLISSKSPLSTEEAMSLSASRYCTYEVLMDVAKQADVVVGDYFHLFGMGDVFLKRMGKHLGNVIIIVDEAHNMASRLRSHMSSRLSTHACELAAKESADYDEDVRDYCRELGKAVQETGRKYLFNTKESLVSRQEFLDRVAGIGNYEEITGKLMAVADNVLKEKKISFAGRIASFLDSWKKDDFGYARILSREHIRGQDQIVLRFNCLDPSLISKSIIQNSHSTILMSGTLSPMEMHRDLLGMEASRTTMKSYISPFPKHNRKNIIATGITTKYKERTDENFERIADTVSKCIHAIKGNAAVFFPSYEIRDRIYAIAGAGIKKHAILEESRMTKKERDMIKNEMEKHSKQYGAVLFGVLGGSFSEGIDLPGELLNGVVIVGLPLERPDLSVKTLIDYYEQRFRKGMNYGYIYPAMIKVMQASGRCIRSEHDRGVIVFADERFTWSNYRKIFPSSWSFVATEKPEAEIRMFFSPAQQADLKIFKSS